MAIQPSKPSASPTPLCPACRGKGGWLDLDDDGDSQWTPCFTCKGTGWKQNALEAKTKTDERNPNAKT